MTKYPREEPVRYPLPGEIWKHYKGGVYEILSMATHSETQESVVVYRSIPFGSVYVRPFSMWHENVKLETEGGAPIPRFCLMKNDSHEAY